MPMIIKNGQKKKNKNERKVTRLQHPLKLGQRTTNHEESLWLTSQGLSLGSIKPYGTLEQTVLQR